MRQPQLADLDAVHQRLRRDRHLQQVGGDPLERRGLDVEVARLAAPGDAQHLGHQRQRRPGQQGVDHDEDEDDVEELGRHPSTPSASGIVASTIGTAPRSPAQERNASSRTGIGCTSAADHHRQRPGHEGQDQTGHDRDAARCAGRCRLGETSRPSITNSPIWASQATPSENDRVAAAVRQLGVAEDQRGDVHRGEAGRRAAAAVPAYASTVKESTASG